MFLAALGYTFLIIGIALLIIGPVQAAQNRRRTAEAEGYVSEVRKKYVRKKGTTYYIDFEFTADGAAQLLKNVKWPLPPEQQTYTICYNPKKPKDAHVKEFRTANPKVFLIIGAVLTVIAVILVAVATKGGVA